MKIPTKPIRLFRHTSCDKQGYLCEFLLKHQIPFEIACIGCADGASMEVPDSLDDVSGLIFMGGPGDVNAPIGWMRDEIELIQRAARHGTPVMGVCLGAQMISKALGGVVSSDYRLEVGWHHVEKATSNDISHWFAGLPRRFEVFQWHAHDFSLPPGATPLLSSRCTPHQAYALGNILAMQFHMEVSAETVKRHTRLYKGDVETQSSCVQPAAQMLAHLDERVKVLHQNAAKIYSNWLSRL